MHCYVELTGSQPPGWERILRGSASSQATGGRASKDRFPARRLGTRQLLTPNS